MKPHLLAAVAEQEALDAAERAYHPVTAGVRACARDSDRKVVCRLLTDMVKIGLGDPSLGEWARTVHGIRDGLPDDGTDLRARLTRLACALERRTGTPENKTWRTPARKPISAEYVARVVGDVWRAVGAAGAVCPGVDRETAFRPNLTRAEQVCALNGIAEDLPNSWYRICDRARDTGDLLEMLTSKLPERFREDPSVNLSDRQLPRADLSGLNLGGSELSDADLEGANLSDTDLDQSNSMRVNLRGANLDRTSARWSIWEGSDFTKVRSQGANWMGADFTTVPFHGADLRGSIFEDANFSGADVTGASFRDADLRRVRMLGVDLEHFKRADLTGAQTESAQFPVEGAQWL